MNEDQIFYIAFIPCKWTLIFNMFLQSCHNAFFMLIYHSVLNVPLVHVRKRMLEFISNDRESALWNLID